MSVRDVRARDDVRGRKARDRPGLSVGGRFARSGVLITPLVLVNSAAIYGQVQWAAGHLTAGDYLQAVLFALVLESIAVYLAYEAHAALIAGDASFRLRVASYLAAFVVGALNYSHFAAEDLAPTTASLAFGGLSAVSPWLWSIRSRSLRRDQLRAAGLIDPRSAHFAAAKWIHFPVRTVRAYRWSIDHGVQEERAAWEACRQVTHERTIERARKRARRRGERSRPHAGARTAESAVAPRVVTDAGWVVNEDRPAETVGHEPETRRRPDAEELRAWIAARTSEGEVVTGAVVGRHFGVSAATGRRWLQAARAVAAPAVHDDDVVAEPAAGLVESGLSSR